MSEMSLNDAAKLIPSDKFTLTPDQSAKVRFLYVSFDNVKIDIVHPAKFRGVFNNEIKEFDKWVKCSRTFNDGLNDFCLFCNNGLKFDRKLFLHVYNMSLGQVQIWTAPFSIGAILQSATRNAIGQLCQNIYEIGRTGEKLQTRYSILPLANKEDGRLIFDDKTIDKFPEILNKYQQKFISVKTSEEIEEYFQKGYFKYIQEKIEESNIEIVKKASQPVRRNVSTDLVDDSPF